MSHEHRSELTCYKPQVKMVLQIAKYNHFFTGLWAHKRLVSHRPEGIIKSSHAPTVNENDSFHVAIWPGIYYVRGQNNGVS